MVTDRDFLGQETDTAVGLSYLNNRFYDPGVGMFLSVDPLVAATGEAYVYGSGNPITLSDPTGLEPAVGHHEVAMQQCLTPEAGCSGAGVTGQALQETFRGKLVFAALDVGKEQDLSEQDGNLSSDGIESAANVSNLGYLGNDHAAEVVASVASRLLGHKDVWDSIDVDLPGFFERNSTMLTVATFALSVAAVATPCSAVCGVGAAALATASAVDTCSRTGVSTSCGVAVTSAALSVTGVGASLGSSLSNATANATAKTGTFWSAQGARQWRATAAAFEQVESATFWYGLYVDTPSLAVALVS